MAEDIDRNKQVMSCREYLCGVVETITDETLLGMCVIVINNEKFFKSPGSKSKVHHHAYEGGLVVHTSEVMENALLLAKSQSLEIDINSLIAGVVFHDFGKIFDYGPRKSEEEFEIMPHYHLIKHLSRSYGEFLSMAYNFGLKEIYIQTIGHIILSHHGRKDWGSPVEPVLPEAFIIHAADHISSQCAKDYYIRKNK